MLFHLLKRIGLLRGAAKEVPPCRHIVLLNRRKLKAPSSEPAFRLDDSESRKGRDGTLENVRSEASVRGCTPPRCTIVLPGQANGPEHMSLDVGPHPTLSNMQKRATTIDSGLAEGKTSIVVLSARVDVVLERLGFDIDRSVPEIEAELDRGAG